MDLILDIATWVLLLAGSALLLITGLGLLRLPDLYTRIHAGGMADTLATFLIFVGLSLQSGFSLVSVKLLLVIVFIFFTSPTASYALAQASFVAGLKPKLDGFGDRDQTKEDA
ncbi:monovalent cation/H(+) antiporter subunit G [Sneathiella sp. CAU 1612]|jgi:multicomponent Na+:H+ antiporter subunit G|uniref:Monovalent cation/H(+) antiporter subunit G n=1 Tax=Sneathiella sedimenti TaxID=2816034 RepID=A0ABS3F981_9PROT|nr:monovalent cation/H(+) antiporter subunit G [Sneathiella sedimenti]MBO0335089.1 monovalent cation/H(+) antiporter subunit G [Sneathiella sedimenti]